MKAMKEVVLVTTKSGKCFAANKRQLEARRMQRVVEDFDPNADLNSMFFGEL